MRSCRMDDPWIVTIRLRVDVHDRAALIAAASPGVHPDFEYPTDVQSALQEVIAPPDLAQVPGVRSAAVGWFASVEAAPAEGKDRE